MMTPYKDCSKPKEIIKNKYTPSAISSLYFYRNDLLWFRNSLCLDFVYTALVYFLNLSGFYSYT
jgi:hypothetical protein